MLVKGAERPKPFNASMENSSLAERGQHFWCVCEGGGATKTVQNKYKKNNSLAERGEHFWCVCEGSGATKTVQNKYKITAV